MANGLGEWAAGTGQYFALGCVGRGSLGTQGGRKRLFLLLFLSPFWPVLGDTMAERCEWRSMAARRWRRRVRSFRVSKLRKSERSVMVGAEGVT